MPFLHPHDKPYKYLGVWVTPSLNWQHQRAALAEAAVEKADSILRCPASAAQKQRLLETLLRPHIRYSFSTGAYTAADIARLDSIMSCAAKFAWRLPRGTPTALIQEDQERGGMGVPSLQEDYVKEMVALLTTALNGTGRLGAVTYALLEKQVQAAGLAADSALADRLQHSRLLRALTWLQSAGGQIARFTGGGQMQWMQLKGCDLTAVLCRLRNDPLDLGLPERVPLHQFRVLLETGVTSLAQLLEAGTGRMVAASKLSAHLRLHGITARDTPALRKAYNRLTLLLSADPAEGPPRVGTVSAGDLPAAQRELRQGLEETPPAAPPGARYPNGQATITDYLRPANAAEQDATDAAPGEGQSSGSQPAPARRRRPRRASRPGEQLRQGAEGTLQDYVNDLRKQWEAKDKRGRQTREARELRAKHADCPPPWPSDSAECELTDELQR